MNTRASLTTALLLLVSVPACSSGETGTSTAGGAPPGGTSVDAAATQLDTPLDAVPSPSADRIYFVAKDQGKSTLFSVGSSDAPSVVATGFTGAMGVVVGSSGTSVYVADPAAAGNGAIYAVPAMGGAPVEVPGTKGYAPAALDLVVEGGKDQLYFAGVDLADSAPAVFAIPAEGGTAKMVGKGFPFDAGLQGVAKSEGPRVYVTGTGSDGTGTLFAAGEGVIEELVHDIKLGSPAGIALTKDGSTLLISSLDATAGTSQVILYDTAGGTTSIFNDVIKANHASGGVHRALSSDTFAWAGVTVGNGGQGTVYKVTLH